MLFCFLSYSALDYSIHTPSEKDNDDEDECANNNHIPTHDGGLEPAVMGYISFIAEVNRNTRNDRWVCHSSTGDLLRVRLRGRVLTGQSP